ncbi:hypothetical protein BROUX41_000952 [Berkeleyomyces rouxiae]
MASRPASAGTQPPKPPSKPPSKLSPKSPIISDSSPSLQGLLEALQSSASVPSRRMRPDHLQTAADEIRVPLKPVKLARRESRLGLRNIFGRAKSKDSHPKPVAATVTDERPLRQVASKPSGLLRNSFVDFTTWQSPLSPKAAPSSITTATAESSLQPIEETQLHNSLPLSRNRTRKKPTIVVDVHSANQPPPARSQPELEPPTLSPPASVPIPRLPSQTQMYKTTKTPMATWDPPPLFRAYPQAIRHSRLPACSVSADSLLRAHERRNGNAATSNKDMDSEPTNAGADTASVHDNSAEPAPKKKGHRRMTSSTLPKIEWTHKIYVLVTSGYLLQYSGAGAYDRLPEKILHLGKESAAFVTDIFPGKHWVLQVSAIMDAQGTTASNTRSLFSRLLEKRHASNYLMVFENGDDMDGWIGVLRCEIEALGGKKMVSETGEVAPKNEPRRLRAQGSQRTLIMRDPARFSKVLPPAPDQMSVMSWTSRGNRNSRYSFASNTNRYSNSHSFVSRTHAPVQSNRNSTTSDIIDVPPPPPTAPATLSPKDKDKENEKETDEASTINSVVSHDGRQLDSLREHNRLSIVSSLLSSASGQRTVFTSAASSPACSPIRDSFPSYSEESAPAPNRQSAAGSTIGEKHQSVQSFHSFSTRPGADISRQRASASLSIDAARSRASVEISPPTPKLTVPNFSVPNTSMRRFSVARSPSADTLSFKDSVRTSSVRKMPPPALPALPTVQDSPSACKTATTPTIAGSLRSPSHISECFSAAPTVQESPSSSVTVLVHGQSIASRRSNRLATEHNSLRFISTASSSLQSPARSPSYYTTTIHTPRRHHSTRINRTTSANVGSTARHSVTGTTTQTIIVNNRTHIAALASPLPTTPRMARPLSPKSHQPPPISLDTMSNSPKKPAAPFNGAGPRGRRRSFVLEASEVAPMPTLIRPSSVSSAFPPRITSLRYDPRSLKTRPSLTVRLPRKSRVDAAAAAPENGSCSPRGGLPKLATIEPALFSAPLPPDAQGAMAEDQVDAKMAAVIFNRRSMPVITSSPPAPPPTRALPPIPVNR